MYNGEKGCAMPDKKPSRHQPKETVRASISFDSEDYNQLERLAVEKKVSLAWVVREAVSLYIDSDTENSQSTEKQVPNVS